LGFALSPPTWRPIVRTSREVLLAFAAAAMLGEPDLVKERYERRRGGAERLWTGLAPSIHRSEQEKERALVRWIDACDIAPVEDKTLLDVGCGTGDDLLRLLLLGFRPGNLVGCELLDERAAVARHRLPDSLRIERGNAAEAPFADGSFDLVMQSTVFTSLLDDEFQKRLAQRMWTLARPGGGVLWIDFVYGNPRNRDVRGVPLSRVRELFPEGSLRYWRIGLAPPISRLVTRIHPGFYGVFNALPALRTHVICWIQK